MQRIALCACMLIAALGGCAQPAKLTPRPLPDPLLKTAHARPPAVRPAPPPQRAPVATPRPSEPSARFSERELIPPGGIRRGRWDAIVVHHSANFTDTPQSMDDYHRNQRGWVNGLGYHFVIGNGVNTEDGHIYVGPRWKRQITGAHCKSDSGNYFGVWRPSNYFNNRGIGICLIGNFEQRSPTARQLAALETLTQFLCSRAGIDPTRIYGHGDVTHRTRCPGRYLSATLPQVRAAARAPSLRRGLPADAALRAE